MTTPLAARIAWRYLKSKKSHSAVGTISTVSVCAIAVATAAIICILSVFNGFRSVIADRLDSLSPDVMITPAKGKTFAAAEQVASKVKTLPGVAVATPTLTENALVINKTREMPVTLKGVYSEEYARVTAVKTLIRPDEGKYLGDVALENASPATIAIGTAAQLQAYPGDQLLVFAPRRDRRVNLANPVSSFIADSLYVSGVYRSNQSEYDENGVILPIQKVRELLIYTDEATAIEVKCAPGVNDTDMAQKIQKLLGQAFVVKDRMRQQEMNFRMVKIEKWVSFLLLFFILVIASFNLVSSLSMLIIDKENGIRTFAALGMSRGRIGGVFAWESVFVSLIGGVAGLALGVTLVLLQQNFGFITLGGDPASLTIQAYPVKLIDSDILLTMVPVVVIGIMTALVSYGFARSRAKCQNL